MCGIVGIIGNENAASILLQGLEKLEYRGYDSAGIYVNDGHGKDFLVKEKGDISQLKAAVGPEVKGIMGIGHTRWATHGVPNNVNAHPQVSENGRYYLVHNGVISNFEQLRDQYLKGVTLKSETDTEIIVQMIEKFANDDHLATKAAFVKTLKLIEGSYAFLLVDREEPDVIYVAKNKSPLLLGLCDGYNVACSDAMAMLSETQTFVELMDGEVVTLTKDEAKIENLNGELVQRAPYHVDIDASAIGKGAYPFFMLKEIDEQPVVMRKIVQNYVNEDGSIKMDDKLVKAMQAADRLYIVAAGTSYHAGLVGRRMFETLSGVPTEVHVASEFGYDMPLLSEKPFFIFLTQSGETADSRQVLVKVNELGYPSLTITNVENSTLSREANFTLLLHAGPEIAVASTKAYTGQIAIEAILAKALGMKKGIKAAEEIDLGHELGIVANGMQTIVDEKQQLKEIADAYLIGKNREFYIGRAIDYAVSLEAALKLKEISYVQAEGFAAGELKHGTISLIEEDTPVIGIITDKKVAGHTRSNLKEVQSRGAHVLTIVSDDLAEPADQIVLPAVHPLLTPLVSVVPTQLIAYYTSLQRGYDVDKPRNLAKSVTVE